MTIRSMRKWAGAAVLALAVSTVPLTAGRSAADDGGTEVRGIVTEAVQMEKMFIQLWNAKKFDELGAAYYTEDAVGVPPNHEPVIGRAAIIEYMKGAREALGEAEVGEPHRASASGNIVSLVGKYSGRSGKVRITSHEVYERQPDGSLRCTVDMFGFRDPLS